MANPDVEKLKKLRANLPYYGGLDGAKAVDVKQDGTAAPETNLADVAKQQPTPTEPSQLEQSLINQSQPESRQPVVPYGTPKPAPVALTDDEPEEEPATLRQVAEEVGIVKKKLPRDYQMQPKDDLGPIAPKPTGNSGGVIDVPNESNNYGQPDLMGMLAQFRAGAGPVPMERQPIEAQTQATNLSMSAAEAQAQADREYNEQTKPILETHANELRRLGDEGAARAQEQYVAANDFVTRAAHAEDEYAKLKIDPEHYWNSLSTPQKIMQFIANAIGGGAAGVVGGPNHALEGMKAAIVRDTEAQIQNKEGKRVSAQGYRTLADVARGRMRDAQESAAWMINNKSQQTAAMIGVIAARTKDPQIQARLLALQAQINQYGVEQISRMKDLDNKAKLEGYQAGHMAYSLRNAPVDQALKIQELEMKKEGEKVRDPSGNWTGALSPHAWDINTGTAGFSAAHSSLQKSLEAAAKTGMPGSSANVDYEGNAKAAIAMLPLDNDAKASLLSVYASALSSTGRQEAGIKALDDAIMSLQQNRIQMAGGPKAPAALGGVRY